MADLEPLCSLMGHDPTKTCWRPECWTACWRFMAIIGLPVPVDEKRSPDEKTD
jgi:hypothetical protein